MSLWTNLDQAVQINLRCDPIQITLHDPILVSFLQPHKSGDAIEKKTDQENRTWNRTNFLEHGLCSIPNTFLVISSKKYIFVLQLAGVDIIYLYHMLLSYYIYIIGTCIISSPFHYTVHIQRTAHNIYAFQVYFGTQFWRLNKF